MYKTETEVLRECCIYLASQNYFFWRINNIPVYGRSLPKYTPKGLPDIMCIIDGKFYAIECKRAEGGETDREKNGRRVRGGKLSSFQAEWAVNCVLAGGAYYTVHSVEELVSALPGKV